MDADDLKKQIDEWQTAMRRCSYLQAMRDVLPAGPVADALDRQIAEVQTEVECLQKIVLDGGPDR